MSETEAALILSFCLGAIAGYLLGYKLATLIWRPKP